jgi:CysZ protein
MLRALALAIAQLGDRRVLAVLVKSVALTLAIFAALGALGWWALDAALERQGLADDRGLSVAVAALATLIGGWLLFRLVALAVLQLFADEVVAAVEARHYPAEAARARRLGWRTELSLALRGLVRAAAYNLAAAPVALLLLATAIGPAIVFGLVNAVLLGRELTEMVALRHGPAGGVAPLPSFAARGSLGGVIVLLLAVPLANLLAPVIGAAAATHLVHRRTARPKETVHAP